MTVGGRFDAVDVMITMRRIGAWGYIPHDLAPHVLSGHRLGSGRKN